MKPGLRTYGAASLQVRISMGIPAHLRQNSREITKVHTQADQQQEGHATALLRKVCAEADEAGITLILWPRPYGDEIALSQAQLIRWYARTFGFRQIQAEPPMMARAPWSTPLYLKPIPSAVACYG